MKKLTLTSAAFMALAATSVFAHHPSEEMNPNFDTITEQLEDSGSPHLDMDTDAMGSAGGMDSTSGAIEDATRELSGWESNQIQPSEGSQEQPQTGPGGPSVDTMDLMENVDDSLSE
jgi:hypothetical protein